MVNRVIIPVRCKLDDNIQDTSPKLAAIKITPLPPDRRGSLSPQSSRPASLTVIESDVVESSNLMITLRFFSASTLTSAKLDLNLTTENSVAEAEQGLLALKAKKKADLLLLDSQMAIRKTKLGHNRFKRSERSFRAPADSAGLQTPFKQRLTMDDFMLVDKKIFPANAQLRHPFKFKDYSPDVFRQVRRHFGIDLADYMLTLSGDFNFIEFMSNSKSGQFFFYSHDGRFMIKTQTKDEFKFLRRILPHYYKFVMENPNTLMTRFYGMHRVKMHYLRRKMHFVIMASVFDTPLEIHARYDLKGSRIGRHASVKEHERGSAGVLKDNDLLDKGFHLQMGAAQRAIFLAQLRKDVEFLKRMKIMDYSLLVGVHDSACRLRDNLYTSVSMSNNGHESLMSQDSCTSLPTSLAISHFGFVDVPKIRPHHSASMPLDSIQLHPPLMRRAIAKKDTRLALSPPNTPTWSDCGTDLKGDTDSNFELNDLTSSESEVSRSFGAAFEEYSSSATYSSYGSSSSTPRDASIIVPLSPRLLDTGAYVEYSQSVFCKEDGGICGRDQNGQKNGFVYFLGIIDILQQYNTRKIAETFFKGLRHNRKYISAVAPEFYGNRFIEYMTNYVVRDNTNVSHRLPISPSSGLDKKSCNNDEHVVQ
ncbi:unnamed protein product [Peronospora belbahrii]|uniref:PIPK domain-containing protein n=1 Tax=Peronospora belbahrii TaxID=622444 RepID=A0AAU9KWT2_9STRA|nr:unnamed protein product [Peronospora belbahrii]CAH0521997.1 unnamed protein product [Peronospora belbahrii]